MYSDGAERLVGDPAFADLLASFRVARGLSQERLAELTGLSARAVGDLERGTTRRPRRQTVVALADGLGLDAAERDRLVRAARTRGQDETGASGVSASGLIGRDRELAGLVELLQRRSVRMVSVLGPAGIGKSALAAAALDQLEAATTVVRLEPGDPVVETTRGPRSRGPRLLVIDGWDSDQVAAPVLAALLAQDPELRLLMTARGPVRLRAEHRWPVAALPGTAAVRLLVRLAQEVRPGFVLDDEGAARSIVRRLGGNPMAIGLTAVRLRTQTLSEVEAALVVELAGSTDQVLPRVVRCAVDRLPPTDAQRLTVLASLGRATPNELRRALAAQRIDSDRLDATIALLAANALVTVAGPHVQLAVPSSVREALASGPECRPGTGDRFRPVSTIGKREPVWNWPSS